MVARAAEDPHAVAERLSAERRFEEAAAVYRAALVRQPGEWRLRLGLARTTLWQGRYAEADRHFAGLLSERPGDAAALTGYAQAAYWSGDFRRARQRYRRLLALHPADAEAQRVLGDLEVLTAPRYEVTAGHRDDSQPFRLSTAQTVASYFSDPLTRWDLRLGGGRADGGEESIASIGAAVSVGLPRLRTTVDARAERFRFPDGEAANIGALSFTTSLPGKSAIVVSIDRSPLLGTATAAASHPTATHYSLSWRRDPSERWLSAASVSRVDFFDGNEGRSADAWALAPVYTRGSLNLRAGLSAAWRDTEDDRFRFTRFSSRQLAADRWEYTFSGVYDPYWTPHDLREGRLIVTAETPRLKVQADGGYARDRAVGFGPRSGPTPSPLFIFPHVLERSFRPWRAGAELKLPLTRRVVLRARYRHDVTAFYRANEIEATLAGRL